MCEVCLLFVVLPAPASKQTRRGGKSEHGRLQTKISVWPQPGHEKRAERGEEEEEEERNGEFVGELKGGGGLGMKSVITQEV